MKSIVTRAIISLTLLALLAGCVGGAVTEEEAIKIADDIILQDFPDMVDATSSFKGYTSEDREFYQVTYDKTVEAESDGEIIELPRIVIVTIDKNTGEQFIAVSD